MNEVLVLTLEHVHLFWKQACMHDYKYFKGTERPSDVSVDEIIYDLCHEIKCIMLYCRFTDNGDRANWQTDSSPRLQLLGEGNAAQ